MGPISHRCWIQPVSRIGRTSQEACVLVGGTIYHCQLEAMYPEVVYDDSSADVFPKYERIFTAVFGHDA